MTPACITMAIDGPHVFLRENHTVVKNGRPESIFEPIPQSVSTKVRLWYFNLRTADFEYMDVPDDEFSVGRGMKQMQEFAKVAAKRDDKQWPGDKITYASVLPEVLKTLYNGEYGRDCRRKRAA